MMGNLIEIGKSKFERKKQLWCLHRRLEYSPENETVTCKDCNEFIGPFKAFMLAVNGWWENINDLERRRAELDELEKRRRKGILNATLRVEKAWRSRNLAPCCPHCHQAILPEDGFGGHQTNRQIELARRLKEIKPEE